MKSSTVGKSAVFGVEPRAAGEQALGVGMLGIREDIEHRAVFNHFAAIHDEHFVGDFGDDAQIVRDEQNGHAAFVAELAQDFENLSLDRDIERGRWLVGDEQLGIAGQGHRDHHALLLAARHLMRIGIDALFGIGNAHFAEQVDRPLASFGVRDMLMEDDGLGDLAADRVNGIERGHRLLEDHAHIFAADGTHLRFGELHQVFAQQGDAAGFDASRKW